MMFQNASNTARKQDTETQLKLFWAAASLVQVTAELIATFYPQSLVNLIIHQQHQMLT